MSSDQNSKQPASRRRPLLRALAGSTMTVGSFGMISSPSQAHHNEEPDYKYHVKSDTCDDFHKSLKVDTWYRGYDDDRHKYEWVTAIGANGIGFDDNDNPYKTTESAKLRLDWDDTKYDYWAVEPAPAGYDPEAYAYKEATDPIETTEIRDHILRANADALVSYFGGKKADAVWTAAKLAGNYVNEEDDSRYDGDFVAKFPYKKWYDALPEQTHYQWVFHVYLDFEDRLSVNVTDEHNIVRPYEEQVSSSIRLAYRTYEYHYEVYDDVDHSVNHNDTC